MKATSLLLASLFTVSALGASGVVQAQSYPYIDARPIHLLAPKEDLYRVRSFWDGPAFYDATYTSYLPGLGTDGEFPAGTQIDESANTLGSDGAFEADYNWHMRWRSPGYATKVSYKFSEAKVAAATGVNLATSWINSELCLQSETPDACYARHEGVLADGRKLRSLGSGGSYNGSETGMAWWALYEPAQGIQQVYMIFRSGPRSGQAGSTRILGVGEPFALRILPVPSVQEDVMVTYRGQQYKTGEIPAYTQAQRDALKVSAVNSQPARRLRSLDDRNVNTTLGHEKEYTVQVDAQGIPRLVEKSAGSPSTATGKFHVDVKQEGKLSARTMSVTITPKPEDIGKDGNYYVAASVSGVLFGYNESTGWSPWNNQAVFNSNRSLQRVTIPLANGTNLTGLGASFTTGVGTNMSTGTQVHAGYGTSVNDMLNNVKYKMNAAILVPDSAPRVTCSGCKN